jgi:hypothetical protein
MMQIVFYYISAGYEYKTDADLKEFEEAEDRPSRASRSSLNRLSLNGPM